MTSNRNFNALKVCLFFVLYSNPREITSFTEGSLSILQPIPSNQKFIVVFVKFLCYSAVKCGITLEEMSLLISAVKN